MFGALVFLSLTTAPEAAAQNFPVPPPCDCDLPPLPPSAAPTQPYRTLRPVAADEPADVVLLWNEAQLRAIRAERTPPPLAARNLAIVHASMFDAMNAVDGGHEPYRFAGRAADASPEAAAAVAAHRALTDLYPRQRPLFDAALERSLRDVPDGPAKADGVRLGQQVAEDMLAWRARDGATTAVTYTPRRGAGYWRPTPPDFRQALLPQWPRLTPFCAPSVEMFRPAGPPPLDSVAYARSFQEVRALGGTLSRVRSADQTEIAFFWSDDAGTETPPGHWNRIAAVVSRSRRLPPIDNARLFALLNLALADAGIVCWDGKFYFDFWRPIQGIRAAHPDDGSDPDWTPLLKTPPFPSYPSGHSTFSGAAAAVLADFFGDEVRFTVGSDGLPGVTRSFGSFSAAAQEAGRSRVYGGIHWEFDNADGLACGRSLGEYVSRRFLLPRGATAAARAGQQRSIPPTWPNAALTLHGRR